MQKPRTVSVAKRENEKNKFELMHTLGPATSDCTQSLTHAPTYRSCCYFDTAFVPRCWHDWYSTDGCDRHSITTTLTSPILHKNIQQCCLYLDRCHGESLESEKWGRVFLSFSPSFLPSLLSPFPFPFSPFLFFFSFQVTPLLWNICPKRLTIHGSGPFWSNLGHELIRNCESRSEHPFCIFL